MKKRGKWLLFLAGGWVLGSLHCGWTEEHAAPGMGDRAFYGEARPVGSIQDERLLECSGMDASTATRGLF